VISSSGDKKNGCLKDSELPLYPEYSESHRAIRSVIDEKPTKKLNSWIPFMYSM
jgi:hypothetical protein